LLKVNLLRAPVICQRHFQPRRHKPPLSKQLAVAPEHHQRAPSVRSRPGRVNDQFFLGKKLERAISFHVNGVSKVAVNCWEHCDHGAALMIVGCIIDLLANYEFRHRKLPFEFKKF
jgi:hypothetical protein